MAIGAKTAGTRINDDHADDENEQEHSDEFNEIFLHGF